MPRGRYVSGVAARTTNQRMELTAVLEAVRALDGPLDVVSDSTYVIRCFRHRWWEGWLQRNWSNRQRKPVANRDLWEPLVEIVRHRDIRFRWVKGHSGDPMNELVDQLAVQACRTQQGQQGNVSNLGIATTAAERSLHAPQEPCPSAGDHDGTAR
jgi:ribonuclease HI